MESETDKVARYIKRAFALAEPFVTEGKVRIAFLDDPSSDLAEMFEPLELDARRPDSEFPFGPPKAELGALDWVGSYENDAPTANNLKNAAVSCLLIGYDLPLGFRNFVASLLEGQLDHPDSRSRRPSTFHRDTLLQFIAFQLVLEFGLKKGANKETIRSADSPPIAAASIAGAALYALGCRELTLDQSFRIVFRRDLPSPDIQKLYRLDDSSKLILSDPRPQNDGRRPLLVALEMLGTKYPWN